MSELELETFEQSFDREEQEIDYMSRRDQRAAQIREATSLLDNHISMTRLNHLGCLALVGVTTVATEIFIAHGLTWRTVTAGAAVGTTALLKRSYQKEKATNFEKYG